MKKLIAFLAIACVCTSLAFCEQKKEYGISKADVCFLGGFILSTISFVALSNNRSVSPEMRGLLYTSSAVAGGAIMIKFGGEIRERCK